MTGVRVVEHPDARSFLRRAEEWLLLREDEHNLVLGLAGALSGVAPAEGADGYFFATVERDGAVEGCAFRTPPYKLGVTRAPPEAAMELARAIAQRYADLPAVFGPPEAARSLAGAWGKLKGVAPHPGMPQRMYRLDRVTFPEGVAGGMRAATRSDMPMVHAWGQEFAEDAGHVFMTSSATREGWVERGDLFLWEVGADPVAMAVAAGRTRHGVRVGYVYTARDRRGRGYAAGLTAAVSQRELDRGARFCVLYTDLRNATSNALYPRVGYRPLCDVVDVEFLAPSRGT